ncbi:MAG: SpoIIE family protein phosphatase [Oscillibacter sp.]|nr:SpoIIE family protein phosphatase [Oscillibacter sp.]
MKAVWRGRKTWADWKQGKGKREEAQKDRNLRLLLLGGTALSDLACWAALFFCISRMEPGGRAGILEAVLLGAALVLAVCFVAMRQGIFQQLDDLADTIRHWDEIRPEERRLFFTTLSGPVGQVGNAYYRQISRREDSLNTIRGETQAETERIVKLQIARDICRSALPGRLPDYPSRENFAIDGIVRDGWQNACVYYDYFFVDPGLLCLSVGQVPAGEVQESLYMTVAQTTIRSRLRLGRSLAETLKDVNTQLYDLGGDRSAAVLVGTLDTSNGKFSYVNAGGCAPLLMKNDQAYEWLAATQFAALGQSQNVSFRTQELRLRQGDRLFLHTAGLGAEQGADGTAFRTQELRSALIRTQGQETTPTTALNMVADRAEQFASMENRLGYAALLLEFRKGDRELSHCRVSPTSDSTPEVMEFLKTRFAENGIQRKHYARIAVLAEELFTLCCRKASPEGVLTVECGVAPDGESVNLRITGPFQGRNPLRADQENTIDGQSAEFIQEHAEFTRFKKGDTEDRDTVTVVCFLTQ